MAALSEKNPPTHPQKWSVGPRKWLADLSSSSHLSFTYSYCGCDSEIEFPLDVGCKRQGIKLNFELKGLMCANNYISFSMSIMIANSR